MYMSYCRFEGTKNELRACLENVQEHIEDIAEYSVSDMEIESFQDICEEMFYFLKDNCIINDDAYIDWDELEKVCNKMKNGK